MRRTFAVVTAVVLGLLASAGQAAASDPGGSAEQAAANAASAQAALAAQSALSLAGALQSDPSNANTAVRVISPGNAGSVSQSNTVVAGSVAANGNSTTQSATQSQAGAGTQTAGQIAGNEQAAVSSADAAQLGAANENIDVRVLSPGDSGSVSQSNTVIAGSLAGNGNTTTQTANQSQAGGAGSGSQTAGQAASNEQVALSGANAVQYGPKNRNINVRILSPGNDGSVEQSNTVAGISAALNGNSTTQSATQSSAGGGGTQAALQGATSEQGAASSADAEQKGATNENIGVRILSPGNGGSVSQSNTVIAGSLAKNGNATTQTASQTQAGGSGGTQAVGQAATNAQAALSDADATQYGASNTNIPVRIGSYGDDGAVSQSNTVLGLSAALNGNATAQTATQTQSGAAPAPIYAVVPYADKVPYPEKEPYSEKPALTVQGIGQLAENTQVAASSSDAVQIGAENVNVPVSIGSPGGGGSVSQANTTISAAIAGNQNRTSQTATQAQAGPGTAVQAIGQAAKNNQAALACAKALQLGASNVNAPVRLFDKAGKGDKNDAGMYDAVKSDVGSVEQSNTAAAIGAALNGNGTTQAAGQTQAGGGGSPLVQAVGQAAKNDQAALGTGDAYQRGVANKRVPFHFGDKLGPRCEERKLPCEPKKPEPRTCEPRKEQCEWKRPIEPPSCETRVPKVEPCKRCAWPDRKCAEGRMEAK
jgi:hypothetical protein